jgi:hypothetical protein
MDSQPHKITVSARSHNCHIVLDMRFDWSGCGGFAKNLRTWGIDHQRKNSPIGCWTPRFRTFADKPRILLSLEITRHDQGLFVHDNRHNNGRIRRLARLPKLYPIVHHPLRPFALESQRAPPSSGNWGTGVPVASVETFPKQYRQQDPYVSAKNLLVAATLIDQLWSRAAIDDNADIEL